LKQRTKKLQEDLEKERIAARPIKLKMLEAQGIVKNLEAAVDCSCSCHLSPGTSLHNQGKSCPCQLTAAQKNRQTQKFMTLFKNYSPSPLWQKQEELFKKQAQELKIAAKIELSGAPMVISGIIAERGFYLRERHGFWEVVISSDKNPLSNPWKSPPEELTLVIAEGTSEDLFDSSDQESPKKALEIAWAAVKHYLLQKNCSHQDSLTSNHRFCYLCGILLRDF